MAAPEMDDKTRTELEAAAFRRLVEHLRERADVQNIDLMNLAGFCRNCLSKWYRAAAEERGRPLSDPEAREIIYGMPGLGSLAVDSVLNHDIPVLLGFVLFTTAVVVLVNLLVDISYGYFNPKVRQ